VFRLQAARAEGNAAAAVIIAGWAHILTEYELVAAPEEPSSSEDVDEDEERFYSMQSAMEDEEASVAEAEDEASSTVEDGERPEDLILHQVFVDLIDICLEENETRLALEVMEEGKRWGQVFPEYPVPPE
jgi:hypothetical protein